MYMYIYVYMYIYILYIYIYIYIYIYKELLFSLAALSISYLLGGEDGLASDRILSLKKPG